MAIRGFIFDLDGVLTDTSGYHYQAWQRLADEEGIPFSREQNAALRYLSRRDSLELILDGRTYPEDKLQEMMDRKNRYYGELVRRMTPANILPGVRALLDEIGAVGVPMAVVSASRNARKVVARLQITDLFAGIADGGCVARPKPAPDLFVYAAGLLGLPVEDCVAVEDATAGIEAARTACMYTVGIGPIERVGAADAIFPDLDGVTLHDLVQRLETTTTGE